MNVVSYVVRSYYNLLAVRMRWLDEVKLASRGRYDAYHVLGMRSAVLYRVHMMLLPLR